MAGFQLTTMVSVRRWAWPLLILGAVTGWAWPLRVALKVRALGANEGKP